MKLGIETKIEIPRPIALKQKSVTMIDLYVFGDASVLGCCAAVYAVVYQPNFSGKGQLGLRHLSNGLPSLTQGQRQRKISTGVQDNSRGDGNNRRSTIYV